MTRTALLPGAPPRHLISPSLRALIEAVRADQLGAAAPLAVGEPVSTRVVHEALGLTCTEELFDQGWLRCAGVTSAGRAVRSTIVLQVFNGLVSVLPAEQELGADYVHLNTDSFWLLDLAWKHAGTGTWAAELGTGNGVIAAHLTARFRRVIGTDLSGPWIRCAQLTLEANQARGRAAMPIVCDVGAGLRRGAFELVVANTPWSPSVPLDNQGRELTFMSGGPTGTELPSRFLLEASELVAPGGLGIVLCFDPIFDDGSRPLLKTLEHIRNRGRTVELIESPVMPAELVTPRLQRRVPALRRGAHVAALIRRPRD